MSKHLYLDFYGFKEPPFSITPDPGFLFMSNTHKSVIDKILYGIESRMGFILLVGEVGTGKTTLCRSILDSLDNKAELVYIINPSLSGKEIISSILDDLNVEYSNDSSKKDLINILNRFLLSRTDNKPVVIIIDDAQTMPIDALEDLRLLSNLETDKVKLLQMILVGQPELIDLISKSEMRQLRQRVAISCHLDYLTKEEIEGYIQRRLFIAGSNGNTRFTSKAVNQIFKSSNGIPRLINTICDYSLIAGYISNENVIKPVHVKKALDELSDLIYKPEIINLSRKVSNIKVNMIYLVLLAGILLILFLSIGYIWSGEFFSIFPFKKNATITRPINPNIPANSNIPVNPNISVNTDVVAKPKVMDSNNKTKNNSEYINKFEMNFVPYPFNKKTDAGDKHEFAQ